MASPARPWGAPGTASTRVERAGRERCLQGVPADPLDHGASAEQVVEALGVLRAGAGVRVAGQVLGEEAGKLSVACVERSCRSKVAEIS